MNTFIWKPITEIKLATKISVMKIPLAILGVSQRNYVAYKEAKIK